MCDILEADTKSDSGEAKDIMADHVGRSLLLLVESFIFLGDDTKSDSGDAKEKDSDQTRGISFLEKSSAVDMPLKRSAFHCLLAFSTKRLDNEIFIFISVLLLLFIICR